MSTLANFYMVGTLDSILGFAIPAIIFIALGWWFIKMFKPMFSGIGKIFGGVKGGVENMPTNKTLTYE